MQSTKNLTGRRYGRLKILAFAGFTSADDKPLWQCQCSCGIIKNIRAANLQRGDTRSCGCLCRELSRRRTAQKNPGWKGGLSFHNGYVAVRNRSGKQEQLHRVIAEHALGRELQTDEVVHHINGNKLDNRNCNLLICDKQYHTWLHQHMSQKYMERHLS